jgi:predicted secreted protein
MAKFNGTSLSIYLDDTTAYTSLATEGTAITMNNSVTLSVNTAEVECTNKDSAGWKEFLTGTKDWSMSGSAYIDHASAQGLDEAITNWLAGTLMYATFRDATQYLTGSAYFTNIEQTGELDGTAEWTFTLSGTGALTLGTPIETA